MIKKIQKFVAKFMRYTGRQSIAGIHHRSVWLVSLAVLLTSVTIAAIIPRDHDINPAELLPTTPPQTIQLGDTILPPTINAKTAAVASDVTGDRAESEDEVWKEITIRKGDTLSEILRRAGHDSGEIQELIRTNANAHVFRHLFPGQRIRWRGKSGGPLEELVYETDPGEAYHVVRQENRFALTKEIRSFETRTAHVAGIIETSMFEDGQEAGLSDFLIMKLVEIFGWDIDFALDLRRGDSFAVIHEEKFWQGQKVSDGNIIAAEFVNQGHVFRAVAYRDANGHTSYYTPDGTSVRREFLRTPVEFSRITSRFTSGRFHPILKSWRAHKGVDYAAPTGTPVRSTASGRILALGWNGGYGKRIVIRHNATYSTLYAHLSRFQPSLRVGSFVDQGQTIGYVGATGLASGPHLHYEFQVNGAHRNPLTYKFKGAGSIASQNRDEFQQLAKRWTANLDVIGYRSRLAAARVP